MRNPLTGIRGRVTFTVLAVTAVLYSLLGTIGFLSIADNGRAAIRERIDEVLDQLESAVRLGSGAITLSTADGVETFVSTDAGSPQAEPGTVTVTRLVEVRDTTVVLVGRSSEARLTDSLRSLYRGLWIAIPLASLVSAALAGVATARALRPVGSITSLVDTIGASGAHDRVSVPDTGDEIERLATTFNQMLDRLDAGRLTQRQFTSDAAHELRTPLMAIQGELELITSGAQQPDDSTVSRLTTLTDRLRERIDDLVTLSTLDEQRPLVRSTFDLDDLVRTETAELVPTARLSGHPSHVIADRALVTRAVRNLLANAARHTRTTVAVTIERTPARTWLHVDDDGPGIPPTSADIVFGRFTRLDESRDTADGGSGLGLAIVASVAEAHSGGVVATTSPLGGARLSLWLPNPT